MLRRLLTVGMVGSALLIAASASAALDTKGLLAAFTMDEGKGDTTTDVVKGVKGTIVNGKWVKGPFGQAVELTGGQSVVTAPGLFSKLPNNAISVGSWFQLQSHTTYEGIIGGSEAGVGAVKGECCQYRIMINPGFNPFYNAGGHNDVSVASTVVEQKKWYHYVMTIGKGKVLIYLDGKVIHESAPVNDPLPELKTDFMVGTGEKPGTWPLTGYVDEAFIYDRAITEAEVNEIMKKGFSVALAVSPKGKMAAAWADLKVQNR
ncbi:LamG domain-containing protein [Candidatus Poribacteria bacterium]|nr:LamG domain-containing protein [Candidatus Poribacteria bacterium]